MKIELENFLEKDKKRANRIRKKKYIKNNKWKNSYFVQGMKAINFTSSCSIKENSYNKKIIGILSKTPKNCNCTFCRNPRKSYKELTKQEKMSNEDFKKELKNFYEKC